jgi:hypothetical protein
MKDHRMDIYLDAVTYLALKARAKESDRHISQHVRHLIKQDLIKAWSEDPETEKGHVAEIEGDEQRWTK